VTNFNQNIISVRFLEVLDELIDKRIVENMADFCKKVEYTPQSMSQIRNGKRDVTIDLISKLFTEFKGSPFYVLSGRGPKILEEATLSVVEEGLASYGVHSDNKTVQILEEMVETKNDIIAMLKKEVARLEQLAQEKKQKVKSS
jgi:hypothetical protein